jgi:hypothetical protein
MAREAGLEPATSKLTASCSTIELLPKIVQVQVIIIGFKVLCVNHLLRYSVRYAETQNYKHVHEN